jgi:hypothetical protein
MKQFLTHVSLLSLSNVIIMLCCIVFCDSSAMSSGTTNYSCRYCGEQCGTPDQRWKHEHRKMRLPGLNAKRVRGEGGFLLVMAAMRNFLIVRKKEDEIFPTSFPWEDDNDNKKKRKRDNSRLVPIVTQKRKQDPIHDYKYLWQNSLNYALF